jgi:hypothetical protein
MDKTRKINALQRQFDILIVVNSNSNDLEKPTYTLSGHIHDRNEPPKIETRRRRQKLKITPKSKSIETKIDNINQDNKFIVLNRTPFFQKIIKYNDKTGFCDLSPHYIAGELYDCDFVIMLNDSLIDNNNDEKPFAPLCMAFAKLIHNKANDTDILYISCLCSNPQTYNCGSYLIKLLKYISTEGFHCSEIRVDSVKEASRFYQKQGFIQKKHKSREELEKEYEVQEVVDYNLFYPLKDDEKYTPPPSIKGIPKYIRVSSSSSSSTRKRSHKSKRRSTKVNENIRDNAAS